VITISAFADEISADPTVQMDSCQSRGIRCIDVARAKGLSATRCPDRFLGIIDPSNYVEQGSAPYNNVWADGLAELTDDFHIKDKVPGWCCSPGPLRAWRASAGVLAFHTSK
jgi:hypothetical protein